jgi:hypothetical protein
LEPARAEAGCTVLKQTDYRVSEALTASHFRQFLGAGASLK